MRHWSAALLVLSLLVAGCGYSVRGSLPPHIRTIAIPVFVNRTQEPGVENLITQGVVEAFVNNGQLKVTEPSSADAILEGEVVGYHVSSISFNAAQNITEYRLQITLNLQFRDVKANRASWRREGMQEKADFKVPGQQVTTISREDRALRQAAVEIGRSIVALTIDRF
ncbi:MAG TPA: LptE family protein [Methylomirabilota bacterium]|nr:LptE family protein [Methylomirabilota bacterium]